MYQVAGTTQQVCIKLTVCTCSSIIDWKRSQASTSNTFTWLKLWLPISGLRPSFTEHIDDDDDEDDDDDDDDDDDCDANDDDDDEEDEDDGDDNEDDDDDDDDDDL